MGVRYVCIDLGDKRTGIAVGDAETGLVSPADVIECPIARRGGDELLERLTSEATRHGAKELVVGLPINMDGSEGQRARLVRGFAARIGGATGLAVRFQDERLTSAEADWTMARSGMTHGQKKARRDALAAAAILRDYLSQLGHPPTPGDTGVQRDANGVVDGQG